MLKKKAYSDIYEYRFYNALYKAFGFRTDCQIIITNMVKKFLSNNNIKNIARFLQQHKNLQILSYR